MNGNQIKSVNGKQQLNITFNFFLNASSSRSTYLSLFHHFPNNIGELDNKSVLCPELPLSHFFFWGGACAPARSMAREPMNINELDKACTG